MFNLTELNKQCSLKEIAVSLNVLKVVYNRLVAKDRLCNTEVFHIRK